MRTWVLGLSLFVASCRGPVTKPIDMTPPPPSPMCNDGKIDEGEDCDQSDLGTATCQSLGFDSGRLLCDSTCHYATSLCVTQCGNGALDPGEACDGALGVTPCPTFGFVACTDTCELDQRHCVATGLELGPVLDLTKGGPAVVGDLPPKGPGDLVMAVPSYSRVETFPWVMSRGFDESTGRKLSYQRTPVRTAVVDVDGDGNRDIAVVNQDGTFDHYVFTGSSFALEPIDAGCAGASFLGAGRGTSDGGETAFAQGCDTIFQLRSGGVQRVATPQAVAASVADVTHDEVTDLVWVDGASTAWILAGPDFAADGGLAVPASPSELGAGDLDGDGDADLVALVGNEVALWENAGPGYAVRPGFTALAASFVQVVDLDLDGRPDLVWSEGEDLVVRRNRGSWLFSEVRVPVGPGARLSVAVGDVDGDGDPDLAITVSRGGDATRTTVVLNRVR